MVLGPADFRDGEDVVWRLVWAAWRRRWKEDEITSVDALQASSWAKSTMGTYCTHFRKMALWVGYTPTSELEQAACRYIFQLWGLGYSGSSLKVAVSAFRALEDMGWLPAFVSRRVWRCAKWAPTEPALRPYAGLDDLRNFALACTERPQWTVYGMAVLAFTCLLRVGEAAPLRRGGSRCRGLAFRTVKVAPRIVRRRLGKYAQEWLGWLDARGATSAVVGAQLCPQGPAFMQSVMAAALGAATTTTPGGTHGGGGAPRPCDGWGYPSSGWLGGGGGFRRQWRSTTPTRPTTSSSRPRLSCPGPLTTRQESSYGAPCPSGTFSQGSSWSSVPLTPMSPQNGEMMEMGRRGVGVDRAQGSSRALPLRGLLGGRIGLAHVTRGPLRPLRLLRGPQDAGAGRVETGGGGSH